MEVGSFVALAAVTGGEIIVKNAGLEHLRMSLASSAASASAHAPTATISSCPPGSHWPSGRISATPSPPSTTAPGPPSRGPHERALVTATQAEGAVLFHEKMYESRLFFVDKLIGMGARRGVLCDPHRALVHGPGRPARPSRPGSQPRHRASR